MGLDDRMLSGNEDAKECLEKTIDWGGVQSELSRFREESFCWLHNALKDGNVI